MPQQKQNIKCKKCNIELQDQFCSNCRDSQSIKRIDGQYIISEIGSVLNLDKGIFYTIKELLFRPGLNVQKFILEDRKRLVKPIIYIILCSLIFTLLQRSLNFEDGYVNYTFDETSPSTPMFEWITNNYGYANILISIFIAFWVKIFFKKFNYNFFEILILLCFVIGTGMLIFSFFGIIDSLVSFKIVDKGFFIGVLYISWGIGQFFQKGKLSNYLKGFLCYTLGLLSFSLTITFLGFIIDWISK